MDRYKYFDMLESKKISGSLARSTILLMARTVKQTPHGKLVGAKKHGFFHVITKRGKSEL